jgi:hypothetical protein
MESKFCQRCSVLSLDDTAYDGFESQNDNGEWLLNFHGTANANDSSISYKELRLDYRLSDQLPDLHCLRASAETGCAFCEALRDATLMLGLNTSGHVTFDLRYLWDKYSYGDTGLKYLVVHLEVETESGKEKHHQGNLLFHVDCEPGRSSK